MQHKNIVEIRNYTLKAGTGELFHQTVKNSSAPMLKKHGIDVLAFGFSAESTDKYYLIRAFEDVEAVKKQQDAFYGTREWREGPRQVIIDCIEADASVLIEATPQLVKEFLRLMEDE